MKMSTRCLAFSFLATCCAGQMADAEEVTTRLSKTRVSLDEGIQLTLEYQGRPAQAPDLSPLERDFQIVNRRVTQRLSIVNGRRSQRSGVTLTLRPKRTGVLEMPAIAFGDHWSQPRQIEVLEPPVMPGAIATDHKAVAPAPQEPGAGDWLGARSLRLTEAWPDTQALEAGQAIVRTLTLEAEGVSAGLLPAIPRDVPSGIEIYAQQPYLRDQPGRDGILGRRQERWTLVPSQPGVYRLPKIVLNWWNTASRQWETASLPAREIAVSPGGLGGLGDAPVVSLAPASAQQFAMPSALDEQASDKAPDPRHDLATLARPGEPTRDPSPRYWPWVFALLGLGWLATFMAWLSAKRRKPVLPPPPRETVTEEPRASYRESEWIAALEKSYHASDAGAARSALLGWARSMWSENPPSNLSRLALRCPEPLRQEIIKLENALYSPNPRPWNEQPVWDWVRAFESQQTAQARARGRHQEPSDARIKA